MVTPTGVGFTNESKALDCPTAPKGVIDSLEECSALSNPDSGVGR